MRVTHSPYRIAVVFLHPACNMSCSFCITENSMDTMRFDQGVSLMAHLRDSGFGNVVLGGGEPFAWPHDTVALAEAAKQLGHFVQVGTNGIAMPESYATLLSVDRYVLPLDSVEARIHNTLRQHGPGHHALILDRLATLLETRKSVTISTVVTSQNADGLAGVGSFLAEYHRKGGHLHGWHLYRFIPEGRGGRDNAAWLDVPTDVYENACADVKRHNLGFTVFKRKDMMHSRTVDFFWYQDGLLRSGSEVWRKPPASRRQ